MFKLHFAETQGKGNIEKPPCVCYSIKEYIQRQNAAGCFLEEEK